MVLFTDLKGLITTLEVLDSSKIKAIVAASIRPQYFGKLEKISKSLSIPFLIQPRTTENGYLSFKEKLIELESNFFFINSYSMILGQDLLQIPRIQALNIHYSLLPKNRGSNPIQWGIIKGDKYAGVTLHEVNKGIDTGPIIDQRKTPIFFQDTWLTISQRIDSLAKELISAYLTNDLHEKISSVSQKSVFEKNKRRSPNDGKIEWTMPVIDIYNLIRSLVSPLPGAFYIDGKKKVIIHEFKSINEVVELKYLKNLNDFSILKNITMVPKSGKKKFNDEDNHSENILLNAISKNKIF